MAARAEEEGEDTRVLLLGDSITEELLGTKTGKPRDNWWTSYVWAEYYEGLGSVNLGISGDETQHVLWRMQNGELPDVLQPQSVMVAIGTNNIGNWMDAEDTVGGIVAVVEYLREYRPEALVVVMALFPRADPSSPKDPVQWTRVDEVNESLEHNIQLRFVEGKVRFLNCNERFFTTDSEGRQVINNDLVMDDNLHLTEEGLEAWAECASEDIRSGLTDP